MRTVDELLEAQRRALNGNPNNQIWGNLIFNINSFGANGDGVFDSTSAIQETIDAASEAGGGFVGIPFGTFIISGVLRLQSNVKIVGFGNPTLKLKDNCTPKPFSIFVAEGTPKENIHLEGFTIDCNRANNVDHGTPDAQGNQSGFWPGTLLAAINLTSVSYVQISNMIIENCWGSGIWINDCTNVKINDNVVRDYRISGIAIRNNTSLAGVSYYVEITGNDCTGGTVGIHNIFGNLYVQITNNFCSNNKDSNRFPSYAYIGTYPNVYPSTGGFVTNSNPSYVSPALVGDGAGIEMTGVYTDPSGSYTEQTTVSGNVCTLNQVGIRLEEETRYVTIDSNVCDSSDKHGIFLFSCTYNTISNNVCNGNGEHGINLEKLTSRAITEQNSITGNTCNRNNRFGIALQGARNNILADNILSDNNKTASGSYGAIGLYTVDGINCTRNIIESNQMVSYNGLDKYGIYSDSSSNALNIVTSNVFQGHITAALNLDKSTNLINNNVGYSTASFGQTFIANGSSSVTFAHGMPFAPFNGEIQVTPVNDIGSGNRFWVSAVDATNITISVGTAVTSDTYFNWCVVEDKG